MWFASLILSSRLLLTVITSYSIHYTKLYELGAVQSHKRRLQALSRSGAVPEGIGQRPLAAGAQCQPGADTRGIGAHRPGTVIQAAHGEADEGLAARPRSVEEERSVLLQGDQGWSLCGIRGDRSAGDRITSYNVCYTKLLR